LWTGLSPSQRSFVVLAGGGIIDHPKGTIVILEAGMYDAVTVGNGCFRDAKGSSRQT
jgi:hypothetical protein